MAITNVSRVHPLVTINVISSFIEIHPVVEGRNLADSLSGAFRFRNSSSRKTSEIQSKVYWSTRIKATNVIK